MSEGKKIICNGLAGASAGAIAATFFCPLDVIKTRLQVHGPPKMPPSKYCSSVIIASLKQIVKNEGTRGLYSGLTTSVAALLANWAVYFTVYNQLKTLLQSDDDKRAELSFGANMVAAAGAGAATAVATNPLWVVKIRLQTQGMRPDVVPYKSMISALKRITIEEGIHGLYSGLLVSIAGVSHVTIQFPVYERLKSYLARKENITVEELEPGDLVIASSIAKIIASTMTYPHEVIRSRLQEQGHVQNNSKQYTGVIDCIRTVYHKQGLPGFYRGYATNLVRTTPAAIITFTSYEVIRRFLMQNLTT